MSRLCVTAAGLLGTAFVILATSCTNDFDKLFEGDASSDGGKADTGGATDKDTGSSECSCSPEYSDSKSGTVSEAKCPSCACSCPKLVCKQDATRCSGTCESKTFCDFSCSKTDDCTLTCAAGAKCILRCAAGFNCNMNCLSGTKTVCSDVVTACGAECPKE
jgi:hypothetical protein